MSKQQQQQQSTALASLTATYTLDDSDYEDDDDANDDNLENQGIATLTTPLVTTTESSSDNNKSANSSLAGSPAGAAVPPPPVRVTSKVAKLVSYHDDTIQSDDEDDDLGTVHEVVMFPQQTNNNSKLLPSDNDKKYESLESSVDGTAPQIPPDPAGHCAPDLQDKIAKLHEKMLHQQLDMNAIIQKRKDFRNPSIYEKLIQFCAINELGTNYPPAIYDPLKWSEESYYEELAKVQKIEMDKRERERKSKVEFISGTKKQQQQQDDDINKKRKSKWDQPGGGLNSLLVGSQQQQKQNIKPAGLVKPSLTSGGNSGSSAMGTAVKGTVISAFGSLPKKPRL